MENWGYPRKENPHLVWKEQVRVSDVTCFRLENEIVNLAILLDVFTRRSERSKAGG